VPVSLVNPVVRLVWSIHSLSCLKIDFSGSQQLLTSNGEPYSGGGCTQLLQQEGQWPLVCFHSYLYFYRSYFLFVSCSCPCTTFSPSSIPSRCHNCDHTISVHSPKPTRARKPITKKYSEEISLLSNCSSSISFIQCRLWLK
jgi:hypothetical protein